MPIASDIPYILGVVAFFVASLWLIGRAADRGMLAGKRPPGVSLAFGVCMLAVASLGVADARWLRVVLCTAAALLSFWQVWKDMRTGRQGP